MEEPSENAEVTDEDLIEYFQQGDVMAYEQLIKRYKNRLLNYIYRFIGNQEEAEDIVQETFLRLYRNRNSYTRVAKFSTWIYTIAGNLARTELRRHKRRRLFSLSDIGSEDKDYDIPDNSFNPESYVNSTLQIEVIHKEIAGLSPKFREVIILRDIEELSYEEISKIIQIPIGTVKSRVNRARLRLQKRLKHVL